MNKTYNILCKSYGKITINDYYFTALETTDVKISKELITFKGTEKQLQKFLDKVIKNERFFKVIGIHEHNEEEEQYYKQLLTKKL